MSPRRPIVVADPVPPGRGATPPTRSLRDRLGAVRNIPPFLRLIWDTSRTLTVWTVLLPYCLFAFERGELASHPVLFQLSILPVLTALLRYALLVDNGHGAAPEDVFLADRPLQVLGVIWATLFALGVYL